MSARIRGTLGPRHKAWDDNGGAAKSRIELPCWEDDKTPAFPTPDARGAKWAPSHGCPVQFQALVEFGRGQCGMTSRGSEFCQIKPDSRGPVSGKTLVGVDAVIVTAPRVNEDCAHWLQFERISRTLR